MRCCFPYVHADKYCTSVVERLFWIYTSADAMYRVTRPLHPPVKMSRSDGTEEETEYLIKEEKKKKVNNMEMQI